MVLGWVCATKIQANNVPNDECCLVGHNTAPLILCVTFKADTTVGVIVVLEWVSKVLGADTPVF